MHPAPAILVVAGASGVGKTTLVGMLASLELPGVGCYHFDSIGIPSDAELVERFGDGEAFQAWGLDQWLTRLAHNPDGVRLAVLDAQVRHDGRIARDCSFLTACDRRRPPRGLEQAFVNGGSARNALLRQPHPDVTAVVEELDAPVTE